MLWFDPVFFGHATIFWTETPSVLMKFRLNIQYLSLVTFRISREIGNCAFYVCSLIQFHSYTGQGPSPSLPPSLFLFLSRSSLPNFFASHIIFSHILEIKLSDSEGFVFFFLSYVSHRVFHFSISKRFLFANGFSLTK